MVSRSLVSLKSVTNFAGNSTQDSSLSSHPEIYSQLEKGRRTRTRSRSQPQSGRNVPKRQWFRFPWSRLKSKGRQQRDEDTLLDDLSRPSQTVCTNAWAGTSQNRPSSEIEEAIPSPSKKGIQIKQVISQQSEFGI